MHCGSGGLTKLAGEIGLFKVKDPEAAAHPAVLTTQTLFVPRPLDFYGVRYFHSKAFGVIMSHPSGCQYPWAI
ncbi:hypothetical protein ANAPRD1_01266 [Anaplasma phagocytophilum]|nr:hypothetical protein ANAPRD1_01266 [Anaplasma phagocytophilum]